MDQPDVPVAEAFREVMAGVATPVSVVTTLAGDRPHGTTVSAFASLSMSPPMVLVALDRGSELLARLAPGLLTAARRGWPAAPVGSPARWRSSSTAVTTSSSWATSGPRRRRRAAR